MSHPERYLRKRANYWHYLRRVPVRFQKFDARVSIRLSLKTRSVILARERRNAMEEADDAYWACLTEIAALALGSHRERLRNAIENRYETARLRATSLAIKEAPINQLLLGLTVSEFLGRNQALAFNGSTAGPMNNDDRLMSVKSCAPPPAKVTEAFELYCEKIAIKDLIHKSHEQRAHWRKSKLRSVNNFVHVVGDKEIGKITREDALRFYTWWAEKMRPKLGGSPLGANSANRDIGNVRKLYREYYTYFGDEERPNPFRKLYFKRLPGVEFPPFSNGWVRERLLRPGALDHMRQDAAYLLYVLIETGCRTSEIANLVSSDIVLATDAPYIRIRPRRGREIKSVASVRDIPLVGIALEAMKRMPRGFPRCRDNADNLSPYLLKALRAHELMPTEQHVIYSFRHSFERRMLEASIDYGLRCRLMGHAVERPEYGGGGSMAFRRDQLLKIAHPFQRELFP